MNGNTHKVDIIADDKIKLICQLQQTYLKTRSYSNINDVSLEHHVTVSF